MSENAHQTLPHILIVEDDPATQSVLSYMLEVEYALTLVGDGESALDALAEGQFDLILLDIGLPRINGLDVLRAHRGTPARTHIPVIMISAFSDRDVVIQALRLGANDYVTKPFDIEVLRARIETQLGMHRLVTDQQSAIESLIVTHDTQRKLCRVISHDIQSPLTNFRIAHYLLREMTDGNEEAARVIENMELTLNAVVSMMQVFVDAIELQQLRPIRMPFAAQALAEDVLAQHVLFADRKQIALSVRAAPEWVYGDVRMLNQALSNLVNNALKFSQPHTAIRVTGAARGAMYRFSVADQGPGIKPEDRPVLFGMFSKLRNRPTGGESSTGLGLWIVRQLIELHQGAYGIDTPPDGHGSLFWFEVPIATPEQLAGAGFSPDA
jgi:signal transduction histidine kinase